MSFLSDYISLGGFANQFDITERTARNWIAEEPILSEGVIRRNNSVFLETDAVDDFEDQYLFGESLLNNDAD